MLQPLFDESHTLRTVPENGELNPSNDSALTIFYLFMAFGAVHIDQTDVEDDRIAYMANQQAALSGLSASTRYARALESPAFIANLLRPGIQLIQIMLLVFSCGTCRPSGNGLWQLAGTAMRASLSFQLSRPSACKSSISMARFPLSSATQPGKLHLETHSRFCCNPTRS